MYDQTRGYTIKELDELARGFGVVTNDITEKLVLEFLDYVVSKQLEQERFERELEQEQATAELEDSDKVW